MWKWGHKGKDLQLYEEGTCMSMSDSNSYLEVYKALIALELMANGCSEF